MEAAAHGPDEGIVRTYSVTVDGEEFQVAVENDAIVAINGQPCNGVSIEQTSPHQFSVLLDGAGATIAMSGAAGKFEAFTEARLHEIQVTTERERLRKQLRASMPGQTRTEIRAPMPALVVRIEVKEGESVHEGQGLVILEAMKMENEIKAQASGKVKEIRISAGKAVEKDELLILLE